MKKTVFLIILALLIAFSKIFAQTGIIRTVAGGGTYNGDGVSANLSYLNNAYTVCTDAAENIYFADQNGARVRKVNAVTGIITTVAGTGISGNMGNGGPATNAQIQQTHCIRIDGSGNLYLQEYWDGSIRKVEAATGIITHVAGGGSGIVPDGSPATSAQLALNHKDFCVDDIGNIYVYDTTIRKVDVNTGLLYTVAGGGTSTADGIPATAASIANIQHMHVDDAGNLFFSAWASISPWILTLRKIDNTGIITTIAGGGTSTADGIPATSYSLQDMSDFSIEPSGNVVITDSMYGIIRRINTTTGIINIIAGGGTLVPEHVLASNANLAGFRLIHVSNSGNIFISRDADARISKINDYPIGATVSSDSLDVLVSKQCNGPDFGISTHNYITGRSIKTYFGDGSTDSSVIAAGYATGGYVSVSHVYAASGIYQVKQILYNGTTIEDSISHTYVYNFCRTLPVQLYNDANGNCVKESSEPFFMRPSVITVDSNGVTVDTISAISGFLYNAYSVPGDIYKFKVISTPGYIVVNCPVSGHITDTIVMATSNYPVKYFGLSCQSPTLFDLSTSLVIFGTGTHQQEGAISIENKGCLPVNATATLRYSPNYSLASLSDVSLAPTSSTANSLTWYLPGLAADNVSPIGIYYTLSPGIGALSIGDTVWSSIEVSPVSGDADPANNRVVRVDTVRAGYDPNMIEVVPAGCINSGLLPTQLQYTIHFENTGNDTAHNIYVLDTLPAFVNASSVRMVMASAVMNIDIQSHDGYKVARFDFPNINLLDSSHHGECDGAFIYTINTNAGLIDGTDIMNRVGIYFDYNEVVMTNEAHNQIGNCWPTGVPEVKSSIAATLYPNPVTDILHIDAAAVVQYSITNIVGATLQQGQLQTGDNQLSVTNLPTGMYLITLIDKDGARSVHKIVKQ